MKVSYSEGLANHAGSESCGAAREGGFEALTGEGAGRVAAHVPWMIAREAQRFDAR
jgi:hypothetical protein